MSLFIRLWRALLSLFFRDERAVPARMRMSTPLGVRRLEERRVLNADLTSALLPAPVVDFGTSEAAPVEPSSDSGQSSVISDQQSDAASSQLATHGSPSEVLFIDSRVSDWQTLAAGVRDGVAVHVLDQNTDGLTQIASYLQSASNPTHYPLPTNYSLTAIHIVSHGESGSLLLGSGEITASDLSAFSDQLTAIGAALSADGDILLYGCNVGECPAGGEFLQTLSTLTNADVAASTDLTGAEFLGGDWDLEAEQGVVETGVAFALQTQVDYAGVLPSSAVALTVDVGGLIDLNIVDSGTNNDDLTVSYDSGTSSFVFTSAAGTINGSSSHSVLASTITGGDIFINTFGGDDSLTIQSSAVDALASLGIKINYNGGAQATAAGDELNVTGGTYTTFEYDVTGSGAGGLAFNGYSAITFTGLEPVTVTSMAGTVIVDVDPAGTVAGPRTLAVSDAGGGNLLIDLDGTLEDLTITAPTVELQILGDSDSDDTITVAALPTSFAALTINGRGGAADAVSLNGDITFGAGNLLNVTAESITTGANADLITSGAGTITLTGDDVAIDATSTLSSASAVTLQQQTNGREIDLGSETTGKLSLADAELDRITAGTIVVGNAAAGSILVTQVINPAGTNHLSLHTGGGIFDGHPSTELVVANLTLTAARIGNGLGNEVDTNTTGLLALTTTGSGAAGDIALFSETNLSTNTSRLTVATAASAQTVILNTLGTFTVDGNFGNSTDSLHLTARGNASGVAFVQTSGRLIGNNIDLITSGPSAGDIGTSTNRIAVEAAGTLGLQALGSDIFITSPTNLVVDELVTVAGQIDTIEIHTTAGATLTLTGAVAYTGINGANGDNVWLNADGSLTIQTTPLSVRLLQLDTTGDQVNLDTSITTESGIEIDTLGGALADAGTPTFTVGVAFDVDLANAAGQIDGTITGVGGLAKFGSGTLTLTGANTYTGTTTVNAGTLSVSSTGSITSNVTVAGGTLNVNGTIGTLVTPRSVTVNSGAALTGSGTITGATTIQSGAQHSPGNSPGIQNTGDYSLNVGGALNIEVVGFTTAGIDYDQVNVTGTVTLGGTLNLIDGVMTAGTLGNTLVLIANDLADAVIGTFNGIANGANVSFNGETWRVFYDGGDGNDVVLTFVGSTAIVYVDDDYTAANGFHNGDTITDSDPTTLGNQTGVIGVNAFLTIQQGVNVVDTAGIVHVNAGVYEELVTVNRTMTVRGIQHGVDARTRAAALPATEAVVRGALNGANRTTSFVVGADNVTVDGFTIEDQSDANLYGAAVYVQPGFEGTVLQNNIIQDNVVGVFLANDNAANPAEIFQNLFRNNTNAGPAGGHDIYADNSTAGGALRGATIDNNTFTNTALVVDSWAIGLGNFGSAAFENITISNNAITNHGRGMYLFFVDGADISGNTITGTTNYAIGIFDAGVAADESSNIDIVGNTLTGNNRAIWVDPAAYVGALDIETNSITGGNIALDIAGVPTLNLTNNTITGNTTGGTLANVGTLNLTTSTGGDVVEVNTTANNFSVLGTQQNVAFSSLTTFNVYTLAGSDTVNVAAHATTAINLDGGDPTANPGGDTLNFLTANPTITPTGGGFNVATAGNQTVFHQNFENASYTGNVTFNGTALDDTLALVATGEDSATYALHSGGVLIQTGTLTAITGLTFSGLGGDDVFDLTQPSSDFFNPTAGIVFSGGTQNNNGNSLGLAGVLGDTLVLRKASVTPATADTITYVFAAASVMAEGDDGTITIADAAISDGSTSIQFTGLEPVLDNLDADARVFTFNAGAETITLSAPGDMSLANKIDSTLGESVSFNNPTTSLTINAGTGDDVVNINGVDGAFIAAITIHGDADNDTVNFNTDLTLGSGAVTGAITVTAETINVNANADLDTTGGAADGDVSFTGASTITMNDASTIAAGGATVTMTASGDILISRILSANQATITSTGGQIVDNRTSNEAANITATTVNLSAASGIGVSEDLDLAASTIAAVSTTTGDVDLDNVLATAVTLTTLTTASGTVRLEQSGGGDLTTGAVSATSSATLTNSAGGIALGGSVTAASLVVDASGAVTDGATGDLSITNNASITGNSITLGDSAGNATNFGSLTFNSSNGAVSISEDSDTQLTGTNTADSLTLVSAGAITDVAATSVVIDNGSASFSGTSITLADNGDTLTVSGNASFDGGAGAIAVGANGTVNFGSLTFNTTGGAVTVTEDSSTDLTGTNTADSLTLVSAGAITDVAATSVVIDNGSASFSGTSITLADNGDTLTVSGNASFDGGAGAIAVGANGTVNFGSLTFNTSGGAVTVTEDSSTDLTGTNTADSLTLVSAGAISDGNVGTDIAVTNSASFTAQGGSISIGGDAGEVTNFGFVDASATTSVAISEDSTMNLNAVSGTSATLTSETGAILDNNAAAANVTAATIGLNAATGIGSTGELELVNATSIAAVTTNGAIDLDHSASAAVIVTNLQTGTGSITFDQTGNQALTITTAITSTSGLISISNAGAVLTVTSATAGGSGDVTLTTTAGGDVELGAVTAAGNTVTVTSAGAISDVNAADDTVKNITAGTAVLSAASGIGSGTVAGTNGDLDTSVSSFTSINTGIGPINIDNMVDGAVSVGPVSSVGGTITFTQSEATVGGGGSLTFNAAVTSGDGATNGGDIVLCNEDGGLTIAATGSVSSAIGSGGTLTIGGATVNGAVTVGAGNVTLKGQATDVVINANLISAGSISLTAVEDIIIQALVQSTAGNVSLEADTGTGPLANNGDGGVHVDEAGSVNNAKVQAAGSVTITGADLVEDGTPGDNNMPGDTIESVRIDAGNIAGELQVEAGTTILIASQTGGFKPADSDVEINGNVRTNGVTAADTITITANHDVRFGADGDVTANGGVITVTADNAAGNTGGAINMADGTVITANTAGNVDLFADGDVTLAEVSSTAQVRVTSASGAILDGTAAIVESANITAASTALRAAAGIGSDASAAADIDTSGFGGGTLGLAAETNSGDLVVRNVGDLQITNVDGLNGIQITDATGTLDSGNDQISVIAVGAISVVQAVVNDDGGNILLAAQGTAVDLTINADISATDGNGGVSLYAGDDVTLLGTSVVHGSGSGAILIAAGENYNDGTPAAGDAAGDVTMGNDTAVNATDGAVTIRATGDVTLSSVNTTTTVCIIADANQFGLADNAGRIIDGTTTDAAANITAASVLLDAATGIGDGVAGDINDIDTATAAGATELLLAARTAEEDVNIQHTGSLTVGTVKTLTGVVVTDLPANNNTGASDISLVANGTLTTNAVVTNDDGGDVILRSTAASVAINAAVTIAGNIGQVDIDAGDAVSMAAPVTTVGGLVDIDAVNDVTSTVAGTITTTAAVNAGVNSGNVTITSTTGGVNLAGNIDTRGANQSAATSAAGDVTIQAQLDVLVEDIDARSGTSTTDNSLGGDIQITSTAGGITADELWSGSGVANDSSTAGNVGLTSNSGSILVGSVDTQSGTAATTSTGGAVNVMAAQDVTVGNITTDSDFTGAGGSNTAGSVTIMAGDEVLVTGAILARGADTTLTAGGLGGEVQIQSTGGPITVNDIDVSGGDSTIAAGGASANIALNSTGGGDITLNGTLTAVGGAGTTDGAEGIVSLISGSAVIDGDDSDAADIVAGALQMQAQTGIAGGTLGSDNGALEVDVTTLAAQTESGNIVVSDVDSFAGSRLDGLVIGSVTADVKSGAMLVSTTTTGVRILNGTLNVPAGQIKLRSQGQLTVNNVVQNLDGGDVLLQAVAATSDIVLNANVTSSGIGHISVVAADDIDQNSDIATAGGTVYLFAVNSTSDAISGIDMQSGTTITTDGGNVSLEAAGTGDVLLAHVDAGSGDVTIRAGGSILDNNGGALNVEADALRMLADTDASLAGSIGTAGGTPSSVNPTAIDTAVNTLAAQAANGIYIEEADSITIGATGDISVTSVNFAAVNATVTQISLSDLTTTNNGPIKVVTLAGTITVNEGGDDNGRGISAHGTGDVLLEARGAASDVILNVEGDVLSGSGDITLNAGDDIAMNNSLALSADVSTTGGTVYLLANNATANVGVAQAINMADGTSITSGGGDVLLRALNDGHIGLALVNAGAGDVYVDAQGSIVDNNDGITPDSVNVRAAGVALHADSNGGGAESIGATANAIETDVTALAASSSGAVHVEELDTVSNDDLTIGTVAVTVQRAEFDSGATPVNASLTGVTAADLSLCVDGAFDITQAISVTGVVRIEAAGDVTQTAAGTITAERLGVRSTGGSITLDDGNDVDFFAARTDTAAATIAFNDTDDLTIDFVSEEGCFAETLGGVIGVTTNNGAISVTADDALTIDDGAATTTAIGTVNAGTANVTLTSTTGAIIDGSQDIDAGGAVVANADGQIDVVGGSVTLNAAAGIGADAGLLDDAGDLDINATTLTVSNSTSGHVQIHEADDVALDTVTNSTRLVVLDAAGEITDGLAGEAANITAATAVLRAATGIGNFSYGVPADELNDIDVELTTLAAFTSTGDLFLTDASSLAIDDVGGLTNGAEIDGGTGDVLIRATNNLAIDGPVRNDGSGSATLFAGLGGVNGTLSFAANATTASGHLRATALDDVSLLEDVVVNSGGDAEVHAGRQFAFDETLTGGVVSRVVNMLTGSVVQAAGDVLVTSTGDVFLSRASTATGTVYVVANSDAGGDGGIYDSFDGEGAGNENILAVNASLRAGSGIGVNGTIDTSVTTLAAETDSGNIDVDDVSGLTVGTVAGRTFSLQLPDLSYGETGTGAIAQLVGVTITDDALIGGDAANSGANFISLRSQGPLTVNNPVANHDGGNIALEADGGLATSDVTINAAVTIDGNTGMVDFDADDSVEINAAVTTEGGHVDIDAGTNVTSTAAGTITTTAVVNSGVASGNVTIDAGLTAEGNIDLDGTINTSGASNAAGTGSAAGNITLNAVNVDGGTVDVVDLFADGGDAGGFGGNAGQVTLSAEDAVHATGTLSVIGGDSGLVAAGAGGTVTITSGSSSIDVADIAADGGLGDANGGAGGTITLTAATHIAATGSVSADGGIGDNVSGGSGGTILFCSTGGEISVVDVSANGGNGGNTAGNGGLIILDNSAAMSAVDITLNGQLSAIAGSAPSAGTEGKVVLLTAGGIVDANDVQSTDVLAGSLQIEAQTGIAGGTGVNARLEVDVTNLAASTATGNIVVLDNDSFAGTRLDGLTVTTITTTVKGAPVTTTGATVTGNAGGRIDLEAVGLLTIEQQVDNAGDAATATIRLAGNGVNLSTVMADVTADGGNITVDANTGTLTMVSGSTLESDGVGHQITISADNIVLDLAATISSVGGTVTIAADTANRDIFLGGGAAELDIDANTVMAAGLKLNDAELDVIHAANVNIGTNSTAAPFGGATSGVITVVGGISATANFATSEFQLLTLTDVAINSTVNLTANLAGDFEVLAGRDITQTNATADVSTAGTGFVRYIADRLIAMNAGTSITTINGAITLLANDGVGTIGNFTGITLTDADIATGVAGPMGEPGGDILLRGTGGDVGAGNSGVQIQTGSSITSQGSGPAAGTITIDGTGGPGVNDNRGVSIVDSTLTSVDGDIDIDGRSNGTGTSNVGVFVSNSTIESTGTTADAALITIDGEGGPGTIGNHGVQMVANSLVISDAGNIAITGSSLGTGDLNRGVSIEGSNVESTGTATIQIEGFGGAGANANTGVAIVSGSLVSGEAGDIDIIGRGAGTGVLNIGVLIENSSVDSVGTGLTAADITIDGIGSAGTGGNIGVRLENGDVSVVDGSILITGVGQGTTSGNRGVQILSGSTVTSTGGDAATITIDGTGAAGTIDNEGVAISTSAVAAKDGDISITGVSNGTGDRNTGVRIHGDSTVISSGVGPNAALITIDGTGGPGVDDNSGVVIQGVNTRIESIDGAIDITGMSNGTRLNNFGVLIRGEATVTSTGTGASAATITIDGTGGPGVNNNIGVAIANLGTLVTSVDGDVSITGQGGASATAGHNINHGVVIWFQAVVSSTGTVKADAATITIDGTGADSGSATTDGTFNLGVIIQNAGTLVTSVAGDIDIEGTGGAGSDPFSSGSGVRIANGADITSTGTGANAADITITGTGADGVNQSNNVGVIVTGADTRVAAVDGAIDITGTGGLSSGGVNYGVLIAISAVVETTGNDGLAGSTVGDVTITGLGQGTGDDAFGVYILSATVRTADGDVTVLGTSTSTSATGANGVVMEFGSLVATNNSGEVAITGVAGANGTRDAVIVEDAIVRTNTTQITITGVNDDVRMQGTAAVQSISGDALIQASKDVLLTAVNLDFDAAGAQGTATIIADADTTGVDAVNGQLPDGVGAIIDNLVGESPNIIAAATALCAGSGIGDADDIDTAVATLAAENTTSGQIQIENTIDLTIGTVSGKVGVSQQAPGAATSIVVQGDLTVTQPITSAGGLITLLADENVTFGPLGDVNSNGGNVVVTADADGTGGAGAGAILMQDIAGDSAVINAGSGTVTLTATNDITLGGVVTTNGTAAAVTITSTEGAIVDGGDSAVEITAEDPGAVVTLTAATGIGDGNALETSLAHLVGTVTGTGDVEINEVSPTGLELQNLTTANGSVTVTSVGTILATLVNTSATQNDTNDVSLTTTAAGADILVTAVNAGAINDVTLISADDVANTAAAAASSVIADDLIILANNNTADGPAAIELQTEVQDLTANVLAAHQGNIAIVEVNDLNLATADTSADSRTVSTTNGSIAITTGGDLTVVDGTGGNDDATRTSDVEVTAGGALGGILFTVAGDLELQTFAQLDAFSDTVTPIPTAPTTVVEGSTVTTNAPIVTAIVQGDVQWGEFAQVRTLQAGTGAVVGVARQIAARPDMGPPPSDGTTAFYDASSIAAPTLTRVGAFFQGQMTVTVGQPGEVNLSILIDWGIDSPNRFETVTGLVGGETYTFVHDYTETELLDSRVRRASAADPISVQFGISMEGSMLVLGRSVTTADGLTTAIPDPLVTGINPGLANLTSTDLLSSLVPGTPDVDGTFVENGQAFFVLPAGVGSGIPNFITQVALPVFERVTSFFGDVVQVTTSIVTANRQTQLVIQVLGREEYLELRVLSPDPDAAPLAVRRLPDEFLAGKEGASFTDLFNGLPDGTYEIWYVLGGNRRLLVRVEVRNGKAEIQQDELQGGQLKLEEIIDKLRDELAPQSDVTQTAPQWTAPLEAIRMRRPVRLVEDVEPELAEEALAELVLEVFTPATEESASEDVAAELTDTASRPAAETVEQSTAEEALIEAETTDGEQAAAFAPLAAVAALSGSRRLLRGQAANPFSRSRRAARRMARTGDQAE